MIVTPDISQAAQEIFDRFVDTKLPEALSSFGNNETAIYIYCHLTLPNEPGRRLLVVTDGPVVRVCIEATYELFEGDVHYWVQRVGSVSREEAPGRLEELVREA